MKNKLTAIVATLVLLFTTLTLAQTTGGLGSTVDKAPPGACIGAHDSIKIDCNPPANAVKTTELLVIDKSTYPAYTWYDPAFPGRAYLCLTAPNGSWPVLTTGTKYTEVTTYVDPDGNIVTDEITSVVDSYDDTVTPNILRFCMKIHERSVTSKTITPNTID